MVPAPNNTHRNFEEAQEALTGALIRGGGGRVDLNTADLRVRIRVPARTAATFPIGAAPADMGRRRPEVM